MPFANSIGASSSKSSARATATCRKAADTLGVHRNTLSRKIKDLKIKARPHGASPRHPAALDSPFFAPSMISSRARRLLAPGGRLPAIVVQLASASSAGRPEGRREAADNPVRSETESTHMALRPLHDRILVQRIEEEEQKVGGIIIPDSAKEKPQQGKVVGRRRRQGRQRRQAHPSRCQGRRHDPVRQVLGTGSAGRWRGLPDHARRRSARGDRGRQEEVTS